MAWGAQHACPAHRQGFLHLPAMLHVTPLLLFSSTSLAQPCRDCAGASPTPPWILKTHLYNSTPAPHNSGALGRILPLDEFIEHAASGKVMKRRRKEEAGEATCKAAGERVLLQLPWLRIS